MITNKLIQLIAFQFFWNNYYCFPVVIRLIDFSHHIWIRFIRVKMRIWCFVNEFYDFHFIRCYIFIYSDLLTIACIAFTFKIRLVIFTCYFLLKIVRFLLLHFIFSFCFLTIFSFFQVQCLIANVLLLNYDIFHINYRINFYIVELEFVKFLQMILTLSFIFTN